jgi:hypothetical protein
MKDLKQYVGTKLVSAKPMNRGDYSIHRGRTTPKDEDPKDEGYLVQFEDGYQNWQSKAHFEANFQAIKEGMPFSMALDMVRNQGGRAARKGWNGKGMFIFLVPGSTFIVNREPLLSILGEGKEVKYHGHIDMKTADGMIVPWLASQTDILADDWMVV